MSTYDDKKNNRISRIVNEPKTHSDSREFKNHKFKLLLDFIDSNLNDLYSDDVIEWEVSQSNTENINTIKAKLLFNKERIRGIDRNPAPRRFKYIPGTELKSYWHENKIYYKDKLQENDHIQLPDWKESYSLIEFTLKVAKHWNIDTWSEDEDYSLLGRLENEELI